jgi:alpha-D-ribose 1-methylphosphonate 5-triphosphate synthase subunit PhnG
MLRMRINTSVKSGLSHCLGRDKNPAKACQMVLVLCQTSPGRV